ncbi:hypothetical protein [Symbiobacterium thermophilum]|uniref:Uncharacterized protein n=1 Tax=Symbiobacterium thermophilum TaxID=2734 RepID=A0A953I9B3_SYMTR|nr:hypothetical protein [Symbiobacterium thermophilum]MBY6275996.1 hypothetical protein [Symbiobacterium thermophilum]
MQVVRAGSWQRWAVAGAALLLVLVYALQWLAGGGEIELHQVMNYFQVVSSMMIVTWVGDRRNRPTMLTGSVLRVARAFGWEAIPLAAAEVKPLRTGWQVRWNDGREVRRLSLVTPPEFREAVLRAAEQARAALPGEAPRTVREALLAVPLAERSAVRGRGAAYLALLTVLPLLSLWLNHPWPLFGLPVLVWFQDRIFAGTTVVLSDRILWLLGAQGPVDQIPLERVRSVEGVKRNRVLLRLDDPRHPALKLFRYHEGVDVLAQIEKAMAGQPLFTPAGEGVSQAAAARAGDDPTAGEAVSPAGGGVLRCALCGRSAPGTPGAGTIHICERCQHRARYEAQEAGHGLQGREPLPM